jgi:hypothetical protein
VEALADGAEIVADCVEIVADVSTLPCIVEAAGTGVSNAL